MHLLLISYEFTFSPFSGNGILARSLVKSLLGSSCDVRMTVLCCQPHPPTSNDQHLQPPEIPSSDSLQVFSISVNSWRCLDIQSAWKDFVVESLQGHDLERFLSAVESCSAALVVDWSGAHAWQSIKKLRKEAPCCPMIYFNFRVFSAGVSSDQHAFYDKMERNALRQAALVVALSEKDQNSLYNLLPPERMTRIQLLFPPLRGDIQKLALLADSAQTLITDLPAEAASALEQNANASFVACIARLGREKQVARFARFVEASPDIWEDGGTTCIPLLAGAVSDHDYAEQVKVDLRRAHPNAVIIDRFLSARELAAVFHRTVLHFHPPAYDAYGMTVVEAAAFRVPSIISNNVGAFATVGDDASIRVEMSQETEFLADAALDTIREALVDKQSLRDKGERGREKALAWDERAYGNAVIALVRSALETKG